ncbi:type I restriction-modification system [Halorhodospira halochloris]|uniref:Type I restriction-modification system n=1 Tax=Halorhodospira halochloris TaxID=1052 RepID=A0A0X8X9U6_HALHR|nr:restriction endonuclease subunit S [Halorhodospira halochloris]MBK1651278.1 restriction endonuclease [Halorhodospira halochloris]BAU57558.1 type I restriction-modification system [Halorhodospira halochloris]
MSFPAYPEYKDSGVEWIGLVPSHWWVCALKRLASICNGQDYQKVKVDKGGYPVLGSGGEFARASDYLYAGESVLLGRKGTIDKPLYVKGPFWTVDTMFYTVVKDGVDAAYLYYYSTIFPFRRLSTNTALPSMSQEDLANLGVAVPKLEEQKNISRFLDHETARIDALIEEQQRLIELLKEKRQAVISHAVTKGLDPDVPMKDSGVEWLGEVPEHWSVGKVRYFAKLESGHTPSRQRPELWVNCTIPWFSLADVWQIRSGQVGVVRDTKEKISEQGVNKSGARLLPRGTVILSRTASVGYAGIMGRPMATTQDFANWVCCSKLKPSFLYYVFRSMSGEFSRLMVGSTHKTIYMPDIESLKCAVPPKCEQAKIVRHLKKKTKETDDLVIQSERLNEILRERRSALISAAVTGKIDVRDWTPPASSTEAEHEGEGAVT